MLILSILIAVTTSQFAQADSEEPAARQAVPMTGQQVYKNVCIACHSPPGVGGAPAFGSLEAWAPRIAQGMDTLIDHALHGFTGDTGVMPKKGERPDLSDEEIIGAVKYMVEQAAQ
jgi:cytochrome c